jgi:hypothetical protein
MNTNSSSFEPVKLMFNSALDEIEAALLSKQMSVLYLIGTIVSMGASEFLLAAIFLTMIVFSNPPMVVSVQDQYRQALSRYRLNEMLVNGAAFCLFVGLMACLAFVAPTHVQLFDKAGLFVIAIVQNVFAGDAFGGNVIPLFELSLTMCRVFFIGHMLLGIVKILRATKREEEWRSSTRTHLFIILVGTVGGVSLGAIAGS